LNDEMFGKMLEINHEELNNVNHYFKKAFLIILRHNSMQTSFLLSRIWLS